MKVLEAYILRKVAMQAAGAVVASLAIVWTTQALTRVNLVTDNGASAGAFLLLATLLLPAIIPIVLPFAALIASTQSLNGMNTDSELAVIHAAGTPRSVIYKPFAIVAIIACVFVILVGNLVEPYARQKARALIAEARADFISLLIQEGAFRKIDSNLFMQVATRGTGGKLGGLFIADSRDAKQDLIYYAREGAIAEDGEQKLLIMKDGEIHQRNPQTGNLSIIKFDSYAFDLTEFSNFQGKVQLLPKDRFTSELINPDPNDKIYQGAPHVFFNEFIKRVSEWLYVPAFILLALVLSSNPRSHRGDAALQTFMAVTFAFVIRWTGFVLEGMADKTGALWPLILLPQVATIIYCTWHLANSSLAPRRFSPGAMQEYLQEAMTRHAGWFGKFVPNRWRRSAP